MTSRSREPSPASDVEQLVLDRVASIPEGRVTTYGDLLPGRSRLAGRVLRLRGDEVPWHRVVRADGSLAQGVRQRELLEAEEVPFARSRVVMKEAWVPAIL